MVKRTHPLDEDIGGVWHPGELELQRRAGAIEKMARTGARHIRDFMPDQHRQFFEQLPFIVIGSVDESDNPWAGIRAGEPGFLRSPDPRSLLITGKGASDDPMEAGLGNAAAVGLLGIELHTRRRNRMNGAVKRPGDELLQVNVAQSFGNCPRYIQSRHIIRTPGKAGIVEELSALDEQARAQIRSADTFFVATYADRPNGRQVDVSHRGGRTGFVAIERDGSMTVPDFAGNRFFATLGNILLNGHAGLLFVDFANGTLLQMSGQAEIVSPGAQAVQYQGAERFWRFQPKRIIRRCRAIALRFEFEAWSPHSLATGIR